VPEALAGTHLLMRTCGLTYQGILSLQIVKHAKIAKIAKIARIARIAKTFLTAHVDGNDILVVLKLLFESIVH